MKKKLPPLKKKLPPPPQTIVVGVFPAGTSADGPMITAAVCRACHNPITVDACAACGNKP